MNPVVFFVRRFLTAITLVVSIQSEAVFMQYVACVVLSSFYLLYVLSFEPY